MTFKGSLLQGLMCRYEVHCIVTLALSCVSSTWLTFDVVSSVDNHCRFLTSSLALCTVWDHRFGRIYARKPRLLNDRFTFKIRQEFGVPRAGALRMKRKATLSQ
uniref:Uncharacterized protein n=1 Tax=Spongospora subterranea TaxID=70186 RepID=A0A0H5QKZ8_9EUKA|eukprot:CRZ02790.1 hypothetical protein [Spongospora subterranea]